MLAWMGVLRMFQNTPAPSCEVPLVDLRQRVGIADLEPGRFEAGDQEVANGKLLSRGGFRFAARTLSTPSLVSRSPHMVRL